MTYFDELQKSMNWLATKPDTLFIGQAIEYEGTAISTTLKDVPREKLLEMPVCEDMQQGFTLGMALNGTCVISIYPRWNFLLLATNQLVNHLDKIHIMSTYNPKVIIRTSIGSEHPLNPQCQHTGNFTDAFRLMCKNIDVIQLDEPEQIFEAYKFAYERDDKKSTILVEWGDYYNTK